jgi:GTP-binding protein
MIPCDTESIQKEYQILLNELKMFNEELLDKPRVLAITKSDLVDEELKELLRPELPADIPHIFISSVANIGIQELKDLLWKVMNEEPF